MQMSDWKEEYETPEFTELDLKVVYYTATPKSVPITEEDNDDLPEED